jgi:hypothetical protein
VDSEPEGGVHLDPLSASREAPLKSSS